MKVYIVGHRGPEHNEVVSIHKTRNGSLKAWNRVRLDLLRDARRLARNDKYGKKMWNEIIRNLSCKDPKKIDNYPHETPYIGEHEVKD
ncbi:hypothetical protein HYZ41_00165 [archaeon]|nr:hypothetical protein [archaeon]